MISGLRIEGLALARGERTLLQGLSFSLVSGEAVALTGVNGVGKTTLLRAVAGFVRPAAGTIRFEEDAAEAPADEARADAMHLLGHADGLKPGRTARQELAFAARWTGAADSGLATAVAALELEPLLDLQVRKLSAGQRRRVAFARLVAAPRPIWLLDEPLAPLDSRRRALTAELMTRHLAQGGMILAAVHDPLPIAARILELEGAAR